MLPLPLHFLQHLGYYICNAFGACFGAFGHGYAVQQLFLYRFAEAFETGFGTLVCAECFGKVFGYFQCFYGVYRCPCAVLFGDGDAIQSRLCHLPVGYQAFYFFFVDSGPYTVWLALAEVLHITLLVYRAGGTVYPPETEGFVNRIAPTEAGFARTLLVVYEPYTLLACMMLLQPFAPLLLAGGMECFYRCVLHLCGKTTIV